ncbi:hypothetical protein B566_EDAN015851 [Ephemera danica]|nr:hypothetical protein B566_EDAN015851 [Ephemera danica]
MDPSTVNGTNYGYFYASASCISFTMCNLLILRRLVPSCAKQTSGQNWKWRNTANSLIHSIISGIWSLYCFWETPVIREDLINKYTASSHCVMSFSIGYFAYDLCDLVLNHRKRSSYELMVHHILVLLCFGLAMTTRYYLGYGLVALLVEVNSVFLHIRQLMLIQGVNKRQMIYRINSFFNVATFIVFRIVTLGWMTRWLAVHRDELSFTAFTLGSISMAVIMVMNIVLFLRVVYADFRPGQRTHPIMQEEEIQNQNSIDGKRKMN